MLIDEIPIIRVDEILRSLREQPILVQPNSIVVEIMPYLAGYDKEALIVINDEGLYKGIISGYDIIKLFYTYDKETLRYMFRIRVNDIMRDVITTNINDSLKSLIRRIIERKFSMIVIIDEKGRPIGLIGIVGLLRIYLTHGVYISLRGIEIQKLASKLIEVSKDVSLRTVMSLMINKNVRRIFVKDVNKVVTDRSIIEALFLPYFRTLLDRPEEILNKPVGELSVFHEPAIINRSISIESAIHELLESKAKCIVNKDAGYIITPWDLVIKPFQLF